MWWWAFAPWEWILWDISASTWFFLGDTLGILLFYLLSRSPFPILRNYRSGSGCLTGLFTIGLGLAILFVIPALIIPYAMAFAYPNEALFWFPIGVMMPILLLTFLRFLSEILQFVRTTPRILLRGHTLPEDVIFTLDLSQRGNLITEK